MFRKIVLAGAFIVFSFIFYSPLSADTAIHLDIEADSGSLYNDEITVAPCDSDNDPATLDTTSAYCAVLQTGLANDWSWAFPPGAFLNSIETVVNNDGDNGVYWGWFVNLELGATGLNEYFLESEDSILLEYNIGPMRITASSETPTVGDTVVFTVEQSDYNSSYNDTWSPATGGKLVVGSDTYDLDGNGTYSLVIADTTSTIVKGQKDDFLDTSELTITPQSIVPEPENNHSSSGSSRRRNEEEEVVLSTETKAVFDIKKAFEFIIAQQQANGSFGEDFYTDWSAIALASGNYQNQTIQLIKYFGESKITGELLTDYERRAMALMALGLNPYNTNGENYIKKITDSFDGKQFGGVNEDNDDIFALIVLQNAGYQQDDIMMNNSLSFILNRQKENGSWDGSVDMTGASIEALSVFVQNEQTNPNNLQAGQVEDALVKAKEFLKQKQNDTGGWDNVSSTAWAIEGILALSEKPEDWTKSGNNPFDYLATRQDADGGTKNEDLKNKIWETVYAISALSGKTWNQIMHKFEKPVSPPIIEVSQKTTQNPEIKKTAKIQNFEKKEEQVVQNVASSVTALNNMPKEEKIIESTQRKSWLRRLFEKIFGF